MMRRMILGGLKLIGGVAAFAAFAGPASAQMQSQRPLTMGQGQRGQDNIAVVAYDLDNDGKIDAVYRATAYDFDRLERQRGMDLRDTRIGLNRMQMEGRQFAQGGPMGRPGMERASFTDQRPQRISNLQGEIIAMKDAKLVGVDDGERRLAKIELDSGKVIVADLGPKRMLERIDLDKGDRITISGVPGVLNDKRVIFASRVATEEGRSVALPALQPAGFRQIKGTVVGTKQVNLRGLDQPQLLAKVETDTGAVKCVNLGPTGQVSNLNIREGKELKVVAVPGRLNDQTVYNAAQVSLDGRQLAINNPLLQRSGTGLQGMPMDGMVQPAGQRGPAYSPQQSDWRQRNDRIDDDWRRDSLRREWQER